MPTPPLPPIRRPSLAPRFFRWHRWLGYAVSLQVAAWVLGGLVFAWLPFQPWVKARDFVVPPVQALPAGWAAAAAAAPAGHGGVQSVSSVATVAGPALKLRYADGTTLWLDAAAGVPLPAPDAEAVRRFAVAAYRGDGRLDGVVRLATVPPRLGLVQETGGRGDVWRARFDDALRTRLYVDARGGELLAVRNEAWVVYDFFWRLHTMDWADGEDFNNPWLRAASLAATGLVATGLVLLALALRRRWRRRTGAA